MVTYSSNLWIVLDDALGEGGSYHMITAILRVYSVNSNHGDLKYADSSIQIILRCVNL